MNKQLDKLIEKLNKASAYLAGAKRNIDLSNIDMVEYYIEKTELLHLEVTEELNRIKIFNQVKK